MSNLSDVKGGDFGSQRTAGIRAYDQMKKSIVQELRENLLGIKIEYLGVNVRKNKIGNFFALIAILIAGFSIIKWKEYERKVLLEIKNSSSAQLLKKSNLS